MAPLIAAALKLLPLVPNIRKLWDKTEEPALKLQLATELVTTAKAALSSSEIVPRENPADYYTQLVANPAARDTFKERAAEREQEWRKLVLQDIQHARVHGEKYGDLVQQTANRVMGQNLYFAVMMVCVQIACMYIFKDNGVILALIGNVVGVVVGQLLAERMQVLSFLFGATFTSDKDKKNDGKSS